MKGFIGYYINLLRLETIKLKLKILFNLNQNPENEAVFKQGVIGNYEPNLEPRSGPGEGGIPVNLDQSEKARGDQSVREFGFNMVASDKISLDRRIKDTRPDE